MSLKRRLGALETRHKPNEWRAALAAECARRRAEFLGRIPPDLRPAVAAALDTEPDSRERYDFDELSLSPFASWATMPPGFEYPRALIECLLNPPRDLLLVHHCGRCGLRVPIFLTWSNDPNPPADLTVFPTCPRPECGGRTSYAANWGPDDPENDP